MDKRRFGRSGHMSTVVVFGTAAFWEIDQAGADAALDLAMEYGVNHIDVAPQYGKAQERLGVWMEGQRDQFFLNCKTLERRADAAWADMENSLRLLKTDVFDLYQLHAVNTMTELDKAFAKGGAIETQVRAREEGITRYLGITGHGLESPRTFIEALRRFDYDAVMFPINPQLYANAEYRADTEELLALCQERDIAVQIIKSIGKGAWGDKEKKYTTWYVPHDTPEGITRGVHFALSQPGVTAIASAGEVRLLRMVLDAAVNFTPMSEADQQEAIALDGALEPLFVPGMF